MKNCILVLLMAATAAATSAQTAAPTAMTAKPTAPSAMTAMKAKPATGAAKPATAATKSANTAYALIPVVKLPAGLPLVKGPRKTAVALQYQDIKVGTGEDAEPGKLFKVLYTGYLADNGTIFDSSEKHRTPVLDKDSKPVLGEDGKPKLGAPEPMSFPQGMGRLIPGFDQGFVGMKVGGKRRIFIPWQLAYGTRAIPDHGADHPGIPTKSDLIFDVELVGISDAPMPPNHPGMGGMPGGHPPMPGMNTPRPGAPGVPPAPPQPGAPAAPTAPSAAPAPAAPATPSAPATAPAAPATAPAAPAPPQQK
jgi:peptidylprolyl isomerase